MHLSVVLRVVFCCPVAAAAGRVRWVCFSSFGYSTSMSEEAARGIVGHDTCHNVRCKFKADSTQPAS